MSAKLYLEQGSRQLVMTEDGINFHPVVTAQTLDPNSIALTSEGYLTIRTANGSFITVLDANGQPVCLMGPQGPKGADGTNGTDGKDGQDGTDGKDGKNPGVLYLDNELDQIFATGDYLESRQVISTTLRVMQGTEQIQVKSSNITVSPSTPSSYLSISLLQLDQKSVRVNIEFKQGFDVSSLAANSVYFNIQANTTAGILTKQFKVIVSQGTEDYDLVIDPSVITISSEGKLSHKSIDVQVRKTKRSLPTYGSTIVSTLPDNIGVFYSADGGTRNLLTYGNDLNIELIAPKQSILVQLVNTQTNMVMDQQTISILRDGANGENSYTAFLSNDIEQCYMINNRIIGNTQRVSTEIGVMLGSKQVALDSIGQVSIVDESGEAVACTRSIVSGKVRLNLTLSNSDTSNLYKSYTITVTPKEGVRISKTFKVYFINGITDYDLKISPIVIKKTNMTGKTSTKALDVRISKKEIMSVSVDRSESPIQTLEGEIPSDLTVQYSIDSGEFKELETLGSQVIDVSNCKTSCHVIMKNANGDIIDEETIEVVEENIPKFKYDSEGKLQISLNEMEWESVIQDAPIIQDPGIAGFPSNPVNGELYTEVGPNGMRAYKYYSAPGYVSYYCLCAAPSSTSQDITKFNTTIAPQSLLAQCMTELEETDGIVSIVDSKVYPDTLTVLQSLYSDGTRMFKYEYEGSSDIADYMEKNPGHYWFVENNQMVKLTKGMWVRTK